MSHIESETDHANIEHDFAVVAVIGVPPIRLGVFRFRHNGFSLFIVHADAARPSRTSVYHAGGCL